MQDLYYGIANFTKVKYLILIIEYMLSDEPDQMGIQSSPNLCGLL